MHCRSVSEVMQVEEYLFSPEGLLVQGWVRRQLTHEERQVMTTWPLLGWLCLLARPHVPASHTRGRPVLDLRPIPLS